MFRSTTARLALACCIAFAAVPTVAASAATQAEIDQSVAAGATWLQGKQTPATGAFPIEFGFDIAPTALAAAGRHPADVSNGGPSSQSATVSALSDPDSLMVGDVQQGILAAHAAGIDPARVTAGASPVATLASFYDDGYYGARANLSSATFGLLSLSETAAPPFLLARGIAAVRANQHNDGSWFFTTTDPKANAGDSDSTSSALAALCGAGVPATDPAVQAGLDYLADGLQASGGFDPRDRFGTPVNPDTNAVAIAALNACGIDPQGAQFTPGGNPSPVDFLIDQQATSGPDAGAFVSFGTVSLYSSTQSVRALGGGSYTADPPARANAGDPVELTPPTVPDGTSAPVALAVDDGAGGVRFCRVTVPSGSSLAAVLATASGSSAPAGCATGAEFTAGQLSKLNGLTGTWAISIDRSGEQQAASQPVRFGDLVVLRRTSRALPVAPAGAPASPPAAVPAAVQARTTPTGVASRSLRVSAKKRVVSVSLSCAQSNRSCEGKVFIVYGKRTLGRREFTIAGGKTTKLNVKLFKSGVKRLGGKKRKVKVNTFSRDGSGIASSSTRTVTLTPTK